MSINYQDFTKICRLCLKTGELQKLFQLKIINLFKVIINIEINESDILPKNVCRICLNQLEDISLFIDMCKNNDTLLRKICLNAKKDESDELDNNSENSIDIDEVEPPPLISECRLENNIEPIESDKSLKLEICNRNSCSSCGEDIGKVGWKKHYRLNIKCRPKDCRCPICEKSFYPRYKLTIHLKSHKKKTPYECPKCLKKFAFAENLRKHAITHKGVKPFVCDICEKDANFLGFLRKRSLDEHMNFHTGNTPYICVYCGKAFKRLTDHAAHIYHTHNGNTEKIPKHKRKYTEKRVHLNIECKTCGKIFASRSGFANHQLIHEGVKKFLCNICGRKFITNPTLQSHMRTHTGEKPFECNECGKSFRQRNSLNTHMSQHLTDKSLNCPKCDKKYHTKNGLNNHLLSHTNQKPLECPECNKQFHLKNALHNHLLNHRDEKPHKCNLCDKSFVSPSHLNVHIRTHSGEKPYPCIVCGKQLAQPQTLKVHMRQHTGETPYMCSVCNKGFHDSSNLRRHFNRHHGSSRNVNKGVIMRNEESMQAGDT